MRRIKNAVGQLRKGDMMKPIKVLDNVISGDHSVQWHIGDGLPDIYPLVVCQDGTSLSVQISAYHHCTPQADTGPYTHVDVSYVSIELPATWQPYLQAWEAPPDTIYANVPVDLVRTFVAEHGGEA